MWKGFFFLKSHSAAFFEREHLPLFQLPSHPFRQNSEVSTFSYREEINIEKSIWRKMDTQNMISAICQGQVTSSCSHISLIRNSNYRYLLFFTHWFRLQYQLQKRQFDMSHNTMYFLLPQNMQDFILFYFPFVFIPMDYAWLDQYHIHPWLSRS